MTPERFEVYQGNYSVQLLMGYIRRAVQQYDMIQEGDKIAVGVSGGKDSVALLVGLAGIRRYVGVHFDLVAITLDMGFGGEKTNYSPIQKLCDELGVEFVVKETNIGHVVFDIRQESNPCSLCAKMRRGALHDLAKELGCNKLALGHHYNDALETFMMNLIIQGRIGCFAPVTYLHRKDITVIRPMCLAPEKDVISAVRRNNLPVVKSACPADKTTAREDMKNFLKRLEKEYPGVTKRLFGAMTRGHVDNW